MRVEGSKRQPYPLIASVTELIAGLCKRESNQPRPGVAPGDPQHEAEGWTWCPRVERVCAAMQRVAQVLLYGKVKTSPKRRTRDNQPESNNTNLKVTPWSHFSLPVASGSPARGTGWNPPARNFLDHFVPSCCAASASISSSIAALQNARRRAISCSMSAHSMRNASGLYQYDNAPNAERVLGFHKPDFPYSLVVRFFLRRALRASKHYSE